MIVTPLPAVVLGSVIQHPTFPSAARKTPKRSSNPGACDGRVYGHTCLTVAAYTTGPSVATDAAGTARTARAASTTVAPYATRTPGAACPATATEASRATGPPGTSGTSAATGTAVAE